MPIPVYNIICHASLDPKKMENIESTQNNENKIKNSLRQMWEVDKTISDKDILDNLIDCSGAPDWIKKIVDKERADIQHDIITKKPI